MGGRGSRSGGNSGGGSGGSSGASSGVSSAGTTNASPVGTPQNPAPNGYTGAVDGKDISDTWTPPSANSTGAEQIESVMDAQGFRGKPKLISDQAEFDAAAAAAWGGKGMVMIRGIGAPDDVTLQAYSDTLTNGEWYVQCGGGAVHGYGQYASYRAGTNKLKRSDINSAQSYADGNGPKTKLFTMTLDPSAKIGEEGRLFRDMQQHNADTVKNSSAVQAAIRRMRLSGRFSQHELAAITDAQNGLTSKKNKWTYGTGYTYYNRAMDKITAALKSDGKTLYSDTGVFAAAKGYDFYYDQRTGYSVTLNRTKLIIKV